MRLTRLLTKVICILALVNGLVFASNATSTSSGLYWTQRNGALSATYIGQIDNGGELVIKLNDILGDYTSIDGTVVAVASGNISTANIQWTDERGVNTESATFTFGTDVTDFDGINAIITIPNPEAITNNVTVNIRVAR